MNKTIDGFHQTQKAYRYLQKIELERTVAEEGILRADLKLTMSKDMESGIEQRMTILFKEIQDLKLKNLNWILQSDIEIMEISGDQLENINYKASDIEGELFSLYCRDFEYHTEI